MSLSLKFSETWQEATVGHMLGDYSFFLNCKTYIQPGWFQNPFVAEIVKVLFDVHTSLSVKKSISKADLLGRLRSRYTDTRTYNEYIGWVERCIASAGTVNKELLSHDLTTWIRHIKLRLALEAGENLFNSEKYDEATHKLQNNMLDIQSTTFDPPLEASFGNILDDIKQRIVDLKSCMTFGSPQFDNQLRDGCLKPIPPQVDGNYLMDLNNVTTGCLAHGDSTVIVGPVNTGKTSVCATIVAANVKMHKDVLFITLEQAERDIKIKLLQTFQNFTIQDINQMPNNDANGRKAEVAAAEYEKHLTYISQTDPGTMYVEDLMNIIQSAQEKRKASHNGKGYDFLVVDYPDLLGSRTMQHQHTSRWEITTFIYNKMYGITRHLKMHGLFPMQTNREGYKVNTGGAKRFLDSGDVAGAYNATHNADNIITLNRSPEDEKLGIMHFHVTKSRFGKKMWTYTTKTAFDKSKTHGIELPHTIHSHSEKAGADMEADKIIKSENPQLKPIDSDTMLKNMAFDSRQGEYDTPEEDWILSIDTSDNPDILPE